MYHIKFYSDVSTNINKLRCAIGKKSTLQNIEHKDIIMCMLNYILKYLYIYITIYIMQAKFSKKYDLDLVKP